MSNLEPSQAVRVNPNIAHLTKRIRSLGRIPFFRSFDSLPSPTQSYLCSYCERFNLSVDSFVVSPKDDERHWSKQVRYLGHLSQIRERNHCPICRLVREIADRPLDQRSPSSASYDDAVCYARWVVDGQENEDDPDRPGEFKFRPKTRRLLVYSQPQAFKDAYLVLLADDAPSRPFFGRQIQSSDRLEPDIIRGWIMDCETNHGDECEESVVHPDLLSKPKNIFRAIDVEDMCIVEIPITSRYVALSYLWGRNFSQLFTTSENLPTLSRPDALTKEQLPRTIKDSIKLTKLLGYRYLWTDSLALIHDAGFQYHDDWVYARAALTVVAGSGKDANAGLPGVRKESRRLRQAIEEVQPGLRLMVSHLAEDYISTSQWDSRAWTFQERILSKRVLLFVNSRIYFQCRRITFCEDMEKPPANGWSLDAIDMPSRIFREPPFLQFTSAVELYTRRELTNPNDILHAFEGMEKVLEKRIGVNVHFGVIESMIDLSLIWESTKLLRRREGFPAWSWSGWFGEVQWKFSEDVHSWINWSIDHAGQVREAPVQQMSRIDPPMSRPAGRNRARRQSLSTDLPLLHCQTISVMFKLSSPLQLHKAIVSPLRKRLTGPSPLSTFRPAPADPGLIRAGIADCDDQWCGTIDLSVVWMGSINKPVEFLLMSQVSAFTDDELEFWEGTLPDDVEDLLFSRRYTVYNVMLVSKKQGIYYREGWGRVLTGALGMALKPGPVWKDIVLG